MATISIAFVLFMVAIPGFGAVRDQLRSRDDIVNVAITLGQLRSEAIRLKRNVRVGFQTDGFTWDIYDDGAIDGTYSLSEGGAWGASPPDILFNGFGLARGIATTESISVLNHSFSNAMNINRNGHIDIEH